MLDTLRAKLQSVNSYLVLVPLLVAVSIITLSLWAMLVSSNSLGATKAQAVDRMLRENKLRVVSSIESYAKLANSGVARLNSGSIDQQSWADFVTTSDLGKNYPGVYVMGVNTVVVGQEQILVERLSNDYGRDITIFPKTQFDKKAPIAYAAPISEITQKAIGLDSYSEAPRREAMDRAAVQNEAIITDNLTLFTDASSGERNDEPSFLMYAPVYARGASIATERERIENVTGYVFLAFIANDVVESFFSGMDTSTMSVTVFARDQQPSNLVYQSEVATFDGSTTPASQSIELYGQTFFFNYVFDDDALVSASQNRQPIAILLSGIILAAMLAAITFFSLRSRHLMLLFEKEREVKMAKDELLSLASHQLRTPATGVKQYMGMVLQGFAGDITKQQKEYLEKAYESNDRQLQVINDILHLAKLDAGRIVLSKRDFDLAQMVRSVAEEQQQDASKGGIVMKVTTPKKGMYNGDSHMFRMVVENLLSNAIKYSSPGSKVHVSLKKQKDGYRLNVRDTGVGIEQSDFPKLFKQFSRISNERSHLVSGTGVGLYLADNLTRLHGGEITVESDPGKGSIFSVFLPFVV